MAAETLSGVSHRSPVNVAPGRQGSYGDTMTRRQRIPKSDQLRELAEEIGGEPLAGSGFEDEMPEPAITDSEPGETLRR